MLTGLPHFTGMTSAAPARLFPNAPVGAVC
jgi:hypothetical protein